MILKCEVKTLQKENRRLRSGKKVWGSSSERWQTYSRQQRSNIKRSKGALSSCSTEHFQPELVNSSGENEILDIKTGAFSEVSQSTSTGTDSDCSWHSGSSSEAKHFSDSQQKILLLLMDSKAEFQLQPSSSAEAVELLLGAGLDRVQAANLLSGANSSGQRPSSQDCGRNQRSVRRLVRHHECQGSC